MTKSAKGVIVFSGFNQRAVIAFIRVLEKRGVEFAIIAKSKEDDILLTEYKDKVYAIRNSVPLKVDDILNSIEKVKKRLNSKEFIIAPSTEALNRFLLDIRDKLNDIDCTIPLVDKAKYNLISDKYSFGSECEKHGIVVPKELKLEDIKAFPVVAKPKEYFSDKRNVSSPVIIKSLDDLNDFKNNAQVDDFYFQEFVDGDSLYLLYYFYKDGRVEKFSQENIAQQPGGKSMIAAVSSDFHLSEESNKYESLFLKLSYFGLVMIEVKQSGKTNYMIEANPRFWGPSQLFIDAGVNLFESFLLDLGIIENTENNEKLKAGETKYFWFGGLVKTLQTSGEIVFHKGDETLFMNQLPDWLSRDIYRRQDTLDIFKKEFSI